MAALLAGDIANELPLPSLFAEAKLVALQLPKPVLCVDVSQLSVRHHLPSPGMLWHIVYLSHEMHRVSPVGIQRKICSGVHRASLARRDEAARPMPSEESGHVEQISAL